MDPLNDHQVRQAMIPCGFSSALWKFRIYCRPYETDTIAVLGEF